MSKKKVIKRKVLSNGYVLNQSLLVEVLSQQSYSEQTKEFRKWLQQYCNNKWNNVLIQVQDGNMYVTKGSADLYPCIVSHIDTVHRVNYGVDVFKAGDNLFAFDTIKMRQYGIGGDDKVGVYICLMMLDLLDNVKVAFFRDEEIGCVGSKKADVSFFNDCAFVLQCDRRGNDDYVTSISGAEICSDEWVEAISPILKEHGYKKAMGMMTDVEALKILGIPLCMNNMSCGYYSPHSDDEYVNITDVANCTTMVHKIMSQFAYKKWEHKYDKRRNYYSSSYDDTGWGGVYDTSGKKVYYGGTTSKYNQQSNLWKEYHNKADKKLDAKYDEFYDKHTWVAGVGWMPKIDAMKFKGQNDNIIGATTVKHGETDTDRTCQACQNTGMTWDAHSEDWFCWYCSEYEGQVLKAIRLAEEDKMKDDENFHEGGIGETAL